MTESLAELSRDRLLMAAVDVFAEKGFRDATVREICGRVEANVASVNYYFRSKENLYAEALIYAFRQAELRYPLTQAGSREYTPLQRLTHFVEAFLNRILDNSALGQYGKLITQEIANPTKALDEVVEIFIKPVFGLLQDIVIHMQGDVLGKAEIRRCVLSILGQCLMFKHSRSVIDRICPEIIDGSDEINACAAHIAVFSYEAILKLTEQRQAQSV
jgi:TetR/AcrR family transcriptional regulator, regulator of cefoperazone and chloramphenicol sensitivity